MDSLFCCRVGAGHALPANDRPPLCCGPGMPGPYNNIINEPILTMN